MAASSYAGAQDLTLLTTKLHIPPPLPNLVERPRLVKRPDEADVAKLSATIDIEALRAYRVAVGRMTQGIVQTLDVDTLKQKVDPIRLQQVMDDGAVVEAARGLVDYWGRRNIAGLLLMPATRHNLVHLNEAWRLKRRRQ